MRPIDANALNRELVECCNINDPIFGIVRNCQTLDVVPVTRCEKCKCAYRTSVKDVYFCDVFECEVDHDFFCKEGGQNEDKR